MTVYYLEPTPGNRKGNLNKIINSLSEKGYKVNFVGFGYPPIYVSVNEDEFSKIKELVKAITPEIRFRLYHRKEYKNDNSKTEVQPHLNVGGIKGMDLHPKVIAEASLFLFEIGRWAASELKERWQLIRQEKSQDNTKDVIDISGQQEEQSKEQIRTMLDGLVVEQGNLKVERILKLVKRKYDLITEWKEMKIDNEEEYNRQLISRATLRIRQEELNEKVFQSMREIEIDLAELGLEIQKS
ncbi:MAG: hypothetical protein ACFFDT_34900 [Candidatus Hodarchaeota archaeon]